MIAPLLAFFVISWPATTQDRCGGQEVMGHYEISVYTGTMKIDPACPLDEQQHQQACARWDVQVMLSVTPSFNVSDPLVGQVVYVPDEKRVAVDLAGNRSDSPIIPGQCGP